MLLHTRLLAKKICPLFTDGFKCELLKNIQTSSDQETYTNQRLLAHKNLFRLYLHNQRSEVKAGHLHALMYSKYFAQRFVIGELYPKLENFVDERGDEELKHAFSEIFLLSDIKDQNDFERRYLKKVEELKKNHQVYDEYVKLNMKMTNNGLNGKERELFYLGSRETDDYVKRELELDLALFKTRRERLIEFLYIHRHANGYITNAFVATWYVFWLHCFVAWTSDHHQIIGMCPYIM